MDPINIQNNHQSATVIDQSHNEQIEGRFKDLHTMLPGIIVSYDPATQTAQVQPAIRRIFTEKGPVNLPLCVDVPVQFPGGGNFYLTFPVEPGDECCLQFSERAIDNWAIDGGVQNPAEYRLHDLSDAVATVGINSQARRLENVQTDGAELRTRSRSTFIRLTEGKIIIKGDIEHEGDYQQTGNMSHSGSVTAAGDIHSDVLVSAPEMHSDEYKSGSHTTTITEAGIHTTGSVTADDGFITGKTVYAAEVATGKTVMTAAGFKTDKSLICFAITNYGILSQKGTATFNGTVVGIDKNSIGLGNVQNYSPADMPLSNAAQSAFNAINSQINTINVSLGGKANLSGANFTGTVRMPNLDVTGSATIDAITAQALSVLGINAGVINVSGTVTSNGTMYAQNFRSNGIGVGFNGHTHAIPSGGNTGGPQ